MIDRNTIGEFRRRIIDWYEENGDKNLPWRNTDNPWHILVATVLLRKTTVNQVLKIYDKFLEKYPSPEALKSADLGELEELIKPLGIEKERAKLLYRIAYLVNKEFNGEIPCSKEKLKILPGVGDYAIAEILLLSCGIPQPLLDRNMIRMLERVLGIKSSKKRPHTDKELWDTARKIVPSDPDQAVKFNFGVLDLARKICTAKKPKCSECPLKDICLYYQRTIGN